MHPRGLDTSEPPPAAAEVCALLGGVISGMDYIHNVQGLLHGDLKPLNMLIKGQKVKLCDFGSSQLLRHAPADLASTGTLPYLAPEILRSAVDEPSDRPRAGDPAPRAGDPAPRAGDPATDVYSFGVRVSLHAHVLFVAHPHSSLPPFVAQTPLFSLFWSLLLY